MEIRFEIWTTLKIALAIGVGIIVPCLSSAQTIRVPDPIIPQPTHFNTIPDNRPARPPEEPEVFKAMDEYFEMQFILKNDSVVHAYTTIDVEDSIHSAMVGKAEKRIKIFPFDTKEVRCRGDGVVFIGVASDSCWLFKSLTGTINGYSPRPGPKAPLNAIQYNDGPIVPCTQPNVFRFVADDPEAKKIAESRNWRNALRVYNKWHRSDGRRKR